MTPVLRPMSADERAQLESIVQQRRSGLRQEISLAFSPWISMLLAYGLAWAILAWLAEVFFGWQLGWHGPWGPVLLGSGISLATLVMAIHVTKSHISRARSRSDLDADLAAGQVEETDLHFTAVKRFQEPEHGGLIYFLRTRDDRVFVWFDSESQDLGVDGKDPLSSSFQPRSELKLVRAPVSRIVVGTTFSGTELPLPAPRELTAPPKNWPESEEYCDIAWEKLEQRFA